MKFVKIAATALFFTAGINAAQAAEGPLFAYVEGRLGYETPTISEDKIYKLGNSASIGIEGGAGLKVSKIANVGAFVNYDSATSETCNSGYCLGSNGNLAYGLRADFRAADKLGIYVKGGADSFSLRAKVPGYAATQRLNGAMGAIGVTFDLSRHAYVGVEANYADLGKFAGANFQRRHVAVTLGLRI